MLNTKEIEVLVGQLFIVGFDGYSASEDIKNAIRNYHLGGTIYFKRNVQSAGQLAELSNELQFSARPKDCPPLIVSIDHEGGKVNRLVKPFTMFPGNDYLGELGSPKVGFEFGYILGKELKAVGINVNYAPVVDVNTNPKNPVIGARSFSSDPEVCGKLGSAVCRGMIKAGVMPVAKHFPGHGDTKEDSHFALPRINKAYEELEKCELIPFRRVIRSRIEGIMTAHILNEALDPEYPATLSRQTVHGILREKTRYDRLIISDDLEMKAISDHYGVAQAAVLAVNAGCDLLIYRGDAGFPQVAFEAVVKAVESGEILLASLQQSVERIASAKKRYASDQRPIDVTEVSKQVGLPEHFRLADMITRKEIPPELVETGRDHL